MIDLFKALADENRMRIVNLLMSHNLCVCEIETILGISQSNTSRHLTKLKQAKVIVSNKDAQWVHYEVGTSFKTEHKDLYDYLNGQLGQKALFQEDLRKLKKYFDLGLDCSDIREDASRVVHLIQED